MHDHHVLRTIALCGVAVGLLLAACGVSDADLNHDTFPIWFKNDLGQPVVIALCNSDHSDICEHPAFTDPIDDGRLQPENIELHAPEEWAVANSSGNLFKCARLSFAHYPGHSPHVLLSEAAPWADPCPLTKWR